MKNLTTYKTEILLWISGAMFGVGLYSLYLDDFYIIPKQDSYKIVSKI